RIEDGYAVADVGVPGVTVSMNNRPAAVTGWHGKALVSDLRAYEVNRISIDPLDLPENTTTAATAIEAVPARGSGVTIAFGGSTGTSAMLVLRDATGAFLPPGTPIALNGAKATIPMGYDGEVWLKDLKAENRIVSTLQNGTCTANFAFQADPTGQTYIEGVMCQ
ncbi:MAG: fimbria/pilus outer membrane usher protein, partial [Aestuariivirgaceae bacterium]|nr:fimbria/pilus outer membrane usher protein [Aestuariivirgaceae bacterium]